MYKPNRDYSFANRSLLDQYMSGPSRRSGNLGQYPFLLRKSDASLSSPVQNAFKSESRKSNPEGASEVDDTLENVALVKIADPGFIQIHQGVGRHPKYEYKDIVLDGYASQEENY